MHGDGAGQVFDVYSGTIDVFGAEFTGERVFFAGSACAPDGVVLLGVSRRYPALGVGREKQPVTAGGEVVFDVGEHFAQHVGGGADVGVGINYKGVAANGPVGTSVCPEQHRMRRSIFAVALGHVGIYQEHVAVADVRQPAGAEVVDIGVDGRRKIVESRRVEQHHPTIWQVVCLLLGTG